MSPIFIFLIVSILINELIIVQLGTSDMSYLCDVDRNPHSCLFHSFTTALSFEIIIMKWLQIIEISAS